MTQTFEFKAHHLHELVLMALTTSIFEASARIQQKDHRRAKCEIRVGSTSKKTQPKILSFPILVGMNEDLSDATNGRMTPIFTYRFKTNGRRT